VLVFWIYAVSSKRMHKDGS